MIKYSLGGVAALVIVAVAAFLILARLNGSNADAQDGPAPTVTFRFDAGAVTPDHMDIDRRRFVVIQVENHTGAFTTVTIDSDNAEQFPLETQIDDRHALKGSVPRPQIHIPPNGAGPGLVRFKESGTYAMVVSAPPNAPRTVTITVH